MKELPPGEEEEEDEQEEDMEAPYEKDKDKETECTAALKVNTELGQDDATNHVEASSASERTGRTCSRNPKGRCAT